MKNYDPSYFLTDDNFIRWRLTRTPELDEYWRSFEEENPGSGQALAYAVRQFHAVRINALELDADKYTALYDRILRSTIARRRRRSIVRLGAAAASIAIFLICGLTLLNLREEVSPETIIVNALPAQDITLISGDRTISFDSNADFSVTDRGVVSVTAECGSTIEEVEIEDIVTHKLIIPRGKHSRLTLPDGSRVWLNAGTELEFPSRFPAGSRRISVNGEVYIEVVRDEESPFTVTSGDLEVNVLGTAFNLSGYRDDAKKTVVLVNGSVEVVHESEAMVLSPGQILTVADGRHSVGVVDTEYYTSWRTGKLKLNRTPVSEILEKVGRYYNIEFQNAESPIMRRTCSGTLILSDDPDEVIRSVCLISGATFSRSGDTVYISAQD